MSNFVIHKAGSRGHANHGWLDSHHTFSFAGYHNAERMHFGLIRVLNDDVVSAGMGFGSHPHENMEIISIPLKGALEHRDSTGRHKIIHTNDVQIMSAGSGITHSEVNASQTEEVRFLQIWVFPKLNNITPRYDQRTYNHEDRINQLQIVVAPVENSTSLFINQDAWFSLGTLKKDFETEYAVKQNSNGVYVFIIEGDVTVNGHALNKRDGLGLWDVEKLSIRADSDAELLLMDVPMN